MKIIIALILLPTLVYGHEINPKEFLDTLDKVIFCDSIEKSIDSKIRSYNILWEAYPETVAEGDKQSIINFNESLDRGIEELFKYTTIYESLCKF